MPDKIFKEFLNFKEMSEKNDYLNSYKIKDATLFFNFVTDKRISKYTSLQMNMPVK
jgi:hypothetical protein